MLKKTVKYENFDGDMVEKTLWFHFTRAEVLEMEMKEKGGLYKKMRRIIDSEDQDEIIDIFKELILQSYGVRDGDDFIKTDDIRDRFSHSEPFSELFIELSTNAASAVDFFSGIMPKGLEEVVEKMVSQSDISQEEVNEMMTNALKAKGKLVDKTPVQVIQPILEPVDSLKNPGYVSGTMPNPTTMMPYSNIQNGEV